MQPKPEPWRAPHESPRPPPSVAHLHSRGCAGQLGRIRRPQESQLTRAFQNSPREFPPGNISGSFLRNWEKRSSPQDSPLSRSKADSRVEIGAKTPHARPRKTPPPQMRLPRQGKQTGSERRLDGESNSQFPIQNSPPATNTARILVLRAPPATHRLAVVYSMPCAGLYHALWRSVKKKIMLLSNFTLHGAHAGVWLLRPASPPWPAYRNRFQWLSIGEVCRAGSFGRDN